LIRRALMRPGGVARRGAQWIDRRGWPMRGTRVIAAVLLSAGLISRAAAGEVALEVVEGIALEVEGATLREALLEVSEAAPFTLVERGAPSEDVVSLAVEAQTWEGLFRKLLGVRAIS
jgi:hypothetical protein